MTIVKKVNAFISTGVAFKASTLPKIYYNDHISFPIFVDILQILKQAEYCDIRMRARWWYRRRLPRSLALLCMLTVLLIIYLGSNDIPDIWSADGTYTLLFKNSIVLCTVSVQTGQIILKTYSGIEAVILSWSLIYKSLFMLNLTEHKIHHAYKC